MVAGRTPDEGIDWGAVESETAGVFGSEAQRCGAPGCGDGASVMLVGNDGEDDVALCMFHLAHQAFLLGAHCASEASALALVAPKQFGKAMLSTSEELGRRVVRL